MDRRTAIVTGAGKRIGRAVAEALLADGWTVIAHVRKRGDPVPEGAIPVAAELADVDAAATVLDAAKGQPPLRLLVNAAARFSGDSLGDFDIAEFDAHMAVNLRAPVMLAEAFARRRADQGEQGDALIVNILDAKLDAPNPDFLSYTLSKFTLAAFTRIAARAWAARQLRVNGIAPALMLRSPGQSEENFRVQHVNNPLNLGVEPADVVEAIRFLLDAPTITGHVIPLDSGQRFMGLARDVQYLGD